MKERLNFANGTESPALVVLDHALQAFWRKLVTSARDTQHGASNWARRLGQAFGPGIEQIRRVALFEDVARIASNCIHISFVTLAPRSSIYQLAVPCSCAHHIAFLLSVLHCIETLTERHRTASHTESGTPISSYAKLWSLSSQLLFIKPSIAFPP